MNETISRLFRGLLFDAGSFAIGVRIDDLPGGEATSLLRRFAHRLCGRDAPEADDTYQRFMDVGADLVIDEMERLYQSDSAFREAVDGVDELFASGQVPWNGATRTALWRVFFPEGSDLEEDRLAAVEDLRRRRRVRITQLNERPLTDPVEQLLFTSNVLVTTPLEGEDISALGLSEEMADRLRAVMRSPQLYFYDHPIHIGIDLDSNEAAYGLRGLNDAVAYEKASGRVSPDGRATVLLSLSVTHDGLQTVAKEYLTAELKKAGPFDHLSVYLFTEVEARALVTEVVSPFLTDPGSVESIMEVFGMDGEYGRHYSFLKAISAVWKLFVDSKVRATFKIDLDQVFPQNELKRQSGMSAFEHFTTPLWGAVGRDYRDRPVDLGMIAGALVNEKDIHRGLFTPDVPYPEEIPGGEAAVFFNKLPMALSTQGEMMTRYQTGTATDGRESCILRYHVTGGTNGILIDRLRRYRPFTPSFIGRAEDQAYILSVLFADDRASVEIPALRYLHQPGLIMRHDKEAFAGASIEAAKEGRFVGDLARTLLFSGYVDALPWGFEKTKEEIDPFTGCFVTSRRYAVVFLRLALHAADLVARGEEKDAMELMVLAQRKLFPLLPVQKGARYAAGEEIFDLSARYLREKRAWNLFYDALDRAEQGRNGTPRGEAIKRSLESARRAALSIVATARVARDTG